MGLFSSLGNVNLICPVILTAPFVYQERSKKVNHATTANNIVLPAKMLPNAKHVSRVFILIKEIV